MTALSLDQILAEELAAVGLQESLADTPAGRARRTLWSAQCPGFGERIYASGRRIYVVQTHTAGRNRTITLGSAHVLSRSVAQDIARRILLRSQLGENPAQERIIKRTIPTYKAYLERYWQQAEQRWKPTTRKEALLVRRTHLEHAFGRKFLDQVAPADVATWFAKMTSDRGPGAANQALMHLTAIFNKAIAHGVLPEGTNPCTGIKRNRRKVYQCFLSAEELERLGDVLARREEHAPMHVAAIRLLMLTGCRRSEIVGLSWSEVRGRRILLHDAKTGPRTVWLGDAAVRLLENIPRHQVLDNVFWQGAKPLGLQSVGDCFRKWREEARLSHVRLHDLRHSFASVAASMSEPLPMIAKLLGHSSIQMTARYAHLDDQPVMDTAERIGRLTASALGEGVADRA